MSTRFNLSDTAAPYTPSTYKGAWDNTASAVTKKLLPRYSGQTYETRQYKQIYCYDYGTEWDGLFYRGVSDPLVAGTIGTGTITVGIGVREDATNYDCYWHLHIYVTQGDSDTVRGTLLSDYRENTTNEFAATNTGTGLQAAASLSSVVVSAGDRIVVEVGFVKRAAVYANATMTYAVPSVTDVTIGDESWDSKKASWIEFSETFTFSNAGDARVTQGPVEVAADTQAPARITQGLLEPVTGVTADNRVTQGYIEVVAVQDDIVQRVSQVLAEYTDENASATERLSQAFVELLTPTVVESRMSQTLIELLTPTVIESRWSQALAEHALAGTFTTRVSQTIVEVLGKKSAYCGEPSISPAPLCGKSDVLAWLEWTVPVKEA